MQFVAWRSGSALLLAVLLSACSARPPLDPSARDELTRNLARLSVPLDLHEFEVVDADGHRGVFLKLSRLPDAVEHRSDHDPPRIVLEIKGPTGTEAPPESFPGRDTMVSYVHVSRQPGLLRVVLDLQGSEVPTYTVHPMADWIMVRLAPLTSLPNRVERSLAG